MNVIPAPEPADVAFNEPYTLTLDDGQEGVVTFTPEQSGSTFYVAAVAMSKVSGTVYELSDDGTTMYGPANIPPTDIDNFSVCWLPCKQFETTLKATITNLSGNRQTYHIQPVGFERSEGR